jgi:hypothetical protein
MAQVAPPTTAPTESGGGGGGPQTGATGEAPAPGPAPALNGDEATNLFDQGDPWVMFNDDFEEIRITIGPSKGSGSQVSGLRNVMIEADFGETFHPNDPEYHCRDPANPETPGSTSCKNDANACQGGHTCVADSALSVPVMAIGRCADLRGLINDVAWYDNGSDGRGGDDRCYSVGGKGSVAPNFANANYGGLFAATQSQIYGTYTVGSPNDYGDQAHWGMKYATTAMSEAEPTTVTGTGNSLWLSGMTLDQIVGNHWASSQDTFNGHQACEDVSYSVTSAAHNNAQSDSEEYSFYVAAGVLTSINARGSTAAQASKGVFMPMHCHEKKFTATITSDLRAMISVEPRAEVEFRFDGAEVVGAAELDAAVSCSAGKARLKVTVTLISLVGGPLEAYKYVRVKLPGDVMANYHGDAADTKALDNKFIDMSGSGEAFGKVIMGALQSGAVFSEQKLELYTKCQQVVEQEADGSETCSGDKFTVAAGNDYSIKFELHACAASGTDVSDCIPFNYNNANGAATSANCVADPTSALCGVDAKLNVKLDVEECIFESDHDGSVTGTTTESYLFPAWYHPLSPIANNVLSRTPAEQHSTLLDREETGKNYARGQTVVATLQSKGLTGSTTPKLAESTIWIDEVRLCLVDSLAAVTAMTHATTGTGCPLGHSKTFILVKNGVVVAHDSSGGTLEGEGAAGMQNDYFNTHLCKYERASRNVPSYGTTTSDWVFSGDAAWAPDKKNSRCPQNDASGGYDNFRCAWDLDVRGDDSKDGSWDAVSFGTEYLVQAYLASLADNGEKAVTYAVLDIIGEETLCGHVDFNPARRMLRSVSVFDSRKLAAGGDGSTSVAHTFLSLGLRSAASPTAPPTNPPTVHIVHADDAVNPPAVGGHAHEDDTVFSEKLNATFIIAVVLASIFGIYVLLRFNIFYAAKVAKAVGAGRLVEAASGKSGSGYDSVANPAEILGANMLAMPTSIMRVVSKRS